MSYPSLHLELAAIQWTATEVRPGTSDPELPGGYIPPGWYIHALGVDDDPENGPRVELLVSHTIDGDGVDITERVARGVAAAMDAASSLASAVGATLT